MCERKGTTMKTTFIVSVVLCLIALYHQGDGSAAQCYFCAVQCGSPLETMDCPSPEEEDSLCVSMTTTDPENNSTSVYKACGPNTDDFKASCASLNATEGSSCYTCDTDLCNKA